MSKTSIFLGLVCVFLWGLTFPLIKFLMLAGTPPLGMVALRFFLGFILFIPFVPAPKNEWLGLGLLSLTLFSLPLALTNYAIAHLDSAIVALASQLEVPFAWLLSVIFLKEGVTRRQGLGLVISFLGIYLLTMTNEVASVDNIHALVLLVFVSFLYGMASIQLKFLRSNPATITVWSFFFSFLLTGLGAALYEPWEEITRVFSPVNFGITALLAALSMFAFYLWTHLLAKNEVNAVVPFIMLVPISTLCFAYLLLGETTELSAQLGGLVTLVGVALQTIAPQKKTA